MDQIVEYTIQNTFYFVQIFIELPWTDRIKNLQAYIINSALVS